MKEFAVTVKLHNNLLRSRRIALGMSAPQVAKAMGVDYGHYVALENVRMSPATPKGWIPIATRIAEFYGETPEALFPDAILSVQKHSATVEVAARDVAKLVAGFQSEPRAALAPSCEEQYIEAEDKHELRSALVEDLSPRERQVLERSFGLDGDDEQSLEAIGQHYSLSRERIRQVQVQALDKLRKRMAR